jgi:hypothetical protein
MKDVVEERLFVRRRDLLTRLDLVFMDTTSLYFDRSSTAPITKPLSIRGDPRRLSGVALHLR